MACPRAHQRSRTVVWVVDYPNRTCTTVSWLKTDQLLRKQVREALAAFDAIKSLKERTKDLRFKFRSGTARRRHKQIEPPGSAKMTTASMHREQLIRPAPAAVVTGTVVAATLGVGLSNYYLFSRPDSFVWWAQKASGGWLNANLLLFVPLTLLVTGGLIMGAGRQRRIDLGLGPGWLGALFGYVAAGWLMIQLLALLAAVVAGDGVALHGSWQTHGAGLVVGLLVAMVFGTALFEETVFRGFLLSQLDLRWGPSLGDWAGGVASLLSSAVVFSLWHLPTLILNRDLDALQLVLALGYMLMGGVLLGLLYLRTGRLALVIACHALVNAPTLVVASPVPGSMIAGAVGLAAIVAGPVLVGQPWRAGFFVSRARPSGPE